MKSAEQVLQEISGTTETVETETLDDLGVRSESNGDSGLEATLGDSSESPDKSNDSENSIVDKAVSGGEEGETYRTLAEMNEGANASSFKLNPTEKIRVSHAVLNGSLIFL